MAVFEVVSGGDRRSLIKRFERKSKLEAVSQLVDFHLLNCTRIEKLEAEQAVAQANLSECLSVLAEAVLVMADIHAPPGAFSTTLERAENFLAAFQGERTQPSDPACEAIRYALEECEDDHDAIQFLKYWNEGEFDILRRDWPNLADALFSGADPLFKPRQGGES